MASGHFYGSTVITESAPESIEITTLLGWLLGDKAEFSGKALTAIPANGGTPEVWFEYGLTVSFGAETPHDGAAQARLIQMNLRRAEVGSHHRLLLVPLQVVPSERRHRLLLASGRLARRAPLLAGQ